MSLMFLPSNRIVAILAICYLFATGHARQFGKRNGNQQHFNDHEIELLRRSKAADIKSWMDGGIDPCTDFHGYVCGNWPRIYADEVLQQGWVSQDTELKKAMNKRVDKFIATLRAGNAIEAKIRNFHQSCLNIAADGCEYIEALKTVYEEYGKFSFMRNKGVGKSRNPFNWWLATAKIYQLYGYDFIIGVSVEWDEQKNPIIFLKQPTMIEPSKNTALMEDFLTKYLGASEEDAREMANEVLGFEKALIDATPDTDKRTVYNVENLSTVHRQFRDLLDVESYLKTALNLAEVPRQIHVQKSRYFDNLLDVFEKTKSDTIEDYILWRLTYTYIIDVDSNNVDSRCSSLTHMYFARYIQNKIYQEFQSIEFENQISDMWQNIKDELLDSVQNETHPWISAETGSNIIAKLKNATTKINSYDEENYEDFFRDLKIDPLNYVSNLRSIHKQAATANGIHSQRNAKFGKSSTSPYYVAHLNEITIPIALMLPYYVWHPSYPKGILYATIGTSVAQEMIQAIDDMIYWDDMNSINELRARLHCYQAKYKNFTQTELQLEQAEQLENIAHNEAVKIAYSAYIRWMMTHDNHTTNDETLPTMSLSSQELFFISYGQRWCAAGNDDLDQSGDYQFKIYAALSNIDNFAVAFNCDANSIMSPEKKCKMF